MAAISQFASGRQQISLDSSYLSVNSGGSTTVATTLYFCLQLENQAGLNLLSPPVGPITIGIGQRLVISLPSTIRKSGEGGFRFVLSASTTSDYASFVQIACLDLYSLSGGVLVENSFPLTLILSRDEHFKRVASVADPASLPTGSDLVNGMVRSVDSTGKLYEYNSNPIWLQSRDRIAASPGTWVRTGSYYNDILATTDGGGCDRSLAPLDPSLVKVPSYGVNGSSVPTTFWLQNRGAEAIPSGTRIGFSITCGADSITELISSSGAMRVRFNGIVKTDYSLETTLTGAGLERLFQNRKTNLALPRDLQPGESYSISCTFNTLPSALDERVSGGDRVKVRPTLYDEAGSFENSGLIWGDLVVLTENPLDQLRRVLPSTGRQVSVGVGSGCVDSFFFIDAPAKTVSDLPEDTDNLKIGINGSGDVYYLSGSVQGYEAVRAVVSTANGTGAAGTYSAYSAVALNAGLDVTCNYPYSNGKATIRADYPDAIAGLTCELNASDITVYVQRQSTGEIRAFTGFPLLAGASQTFAIGNWSAGTVIGSIPTPDTTFGFYQPGACTFTTQSAAGTFPADNYRARFAFEYEGTVTSISHDPADGCIKEVTTTMDVVYEVAKSWGSAVYPVAIRDIPQLATFPGQSRRVIGESYLIYFDPLSAAADDGTNVWRPTWRLSSEPGRWLRQLTMSDSEILDAVKRVDGTGSGLDADLLDGLNASSFAAASHNHNGTYSPVGHTHDTFADATVNGALTTTPSSTQTLVASSTIAIANSIALVTAASNITLTSTPQISTTGVHDGQVLTIVYVGSSGSVLMRDESSLTGSKLRLFNGSGSVTLSTTTRTIQFIYCSVLDAWVQASCGPDVNVMLNRFASQTVSGTVTFNPGSVTAPFAIGTNGNNQTVTGLRAENANKVQGVAWSSAPPTVSGQVPRWNQSTSQVEWVTNFVQASVTPTITGQTLVWNNSSQLWEPKLMGVSATAAPSIASGATESSAFSITKQIIFAFVPNTASARTVKIQYTENGGSTWLDTGVSFDTVTTSPGSPVNSETLTKISGLTGVDASGNGLNNLRLAMTGGTLGQALTITFRSTSVGY